VLRAYLAYRALVRAMVARLEPVGCAAGPDYLAAAAHWCRPGEPRLLITEGLPASGKSHLALALLERCGAIRLRSDVERKRLHGLQPLERSASPPGAGLYTEAATRRTYARLLVLAEAALRAGWPVIIDAAFLRLAQRDSFRRLAHALGLPFTILRCEAPEAVLQARLLARRHDPADASEADAAVLAQARAMQQPLAAHELPHALVAGPLPDPDVLAAAWRARRA
jgi:predicted kinase